MYVASVGPDLLEERMRVGRLLWSNDISAEYSTADNPKLNKQMNEVSGYVPTTSATVLAHERDHTDILTALQ